MIRAQFVINEKYLVVYTLTQCATDRFIPGVPTEDVVAFQNRAWEIDSDAYQCLRFGLSDHSFVQHFLGMKCIHDQLARTERLVDEMLNDPLFVPVREQTKAALSRIESEWLSNYEKTHDLMTELTGLDLDYDFNICVSHPAQKTGKNGDPNIFWTDRNDFPDYNTVYLWHEIMHSFIKPLKKNEGTFGISHAVIELLTDNELRVQLNGGHYPPFLGHDCLLAFKQNLLPSWHKYKQAKEKNILVYLENVTAEFDSE